MSYDVFLSYSRADKSAVLAVMNALKLQGLSTFFDGESLVAGLPWPQALEEALRTCKAVAVFLGPSGMGTYQRREMYFALELQAAAEKKNESFAVVPVLLPNCAVEPSFLFLNTWIDLRQDLTAQPQLEVFVKSLRSRRDGQPESLPSTVCPYQGLRAFREEHAGFYYGRDQLVDDLFAKVLEKPLVAVVGASGGGKSSVVLAGLIPRLRRQRPPKNTWEVIVFRPGDNPWLELALALARLKPDLRPGDEITQAGGWAEILKQDQRQLPSIVKHLLREQEGTDRLLIVVDQFEELLVPGSGVQDGERTSFLVALLKAPEQSPVTVLVTLRADFYGQALQSGRELADAISAGQVNVPPLTRDELRAAIVGPAERVGLQFERGLDARILDEVTEQPGGLPLLEYALTELWAGRQGRLLTHAAHDATGGVRAAIATKANAVYDEMSEDEQKAVRQLMTRLVRVARTGEEGGDTRRRVRRPELSVPSWAAAQKLGSERVRLLVIDKTESQIETVEIAHEALLRHWDRLRQWVREDLEFLLWRQRLKVFLEEWKRVASGKGSVLRGAGLSEAGQWMKTRADELNDEERQFISLSQQTEKRGQLVRAGVAAAVFLLVALAGFAWFNASRQAKVALARQLALAARNHAQTDPILGAIIALEAHHQSSSAETEEALHQAYQAAERLRFRGHEGVINAVAFSGDGRRVATGGDDGHLILWDTESGAETHRPLRNDAKIKSLAFDANGGLIVGGADGVHGRSLDGRAVAVITSECSPTVKIAVRQSIVAVACWEGPALVFRDGLLRHKLGRSSHAIAISPDGQRMATGDGEGKVHLWDTESGQSLRTLAAGKEKIRDLAFAGDGKTLASASDDGTAALWDPARGQRQRLLFAHPQGVCCVAFEPGGSRLATGGMDNTARIWDVAHGTQLLTLFGHEQLLTGVAFAPVGPPRLITTEGERVRRFELDSGRLRSLVHDLVQKSGRKLTDDECENYLRRRPCPAN